MIEIWKSIPGCEDYEISNLGRVKSLKYGKEKILSNQLNDTGYYIVALHADKKHKTRKVHRLVADAFLGPLPKGLHTDHKDDNKLNNRDDNLHFITHRANLIKGKTSRLNGSKSSKFVGVNWNKNDRKWKASFYSNGKQHHLGSFTDEKEASKAYQDAFHEYNMSNF